MEKVCTTILSEIAMKDIVIIQLNWMNHENERKYPNKRKNKKLSIKKI